MAQVPLERMLVETDAPFLAPMPNRGKRNSRRGWLEWRSRWESIKGISADDAALRTAENFERFFGVTTTRNKMAVDAAESGYSKRSRS